MLLESCQDFSFSILEVLASSQEPLYNNLSNNVMMYLTLFGKYRGDFEQKCKLLRT